MIEGDSAKKGEGREREKWERGREGEREKREREREGKREGERETERENDQLRTKELCSNQVEKKSSSSRVTGVTTGLGLKEKKHEFRLH